MPPPHVTLSDFDRIMSGAGITYTAEQLLEAYERFRSRFQPIATTRITIRFSRGQWLAGAVVRTATWSRFAHVGFYLGDNLVLDATPERGVAIREFVRRPSDEFFHLDVSAVAGQLIMEWARSQIGRPYDWSAIVGLAFRQDWHDERSGWFCSEYVPAGCERGGVELLRAVGVWRITPQTLSMSPLLIPDA